MSLDLQEPRSAAPVAAKPAIADCDIHPTLAQPRDILPWLPQRWQRHMEQYGVLPRHGYQSGPAYPKGQPDAARVDAWPPGGRPGSDLGFMQRQHLDPNNVALGVLNVISPAAGAAQNLDFGAALARALNQWQVDQWTSRDSRLKGSVVVPYEDAQAAAAEIEHWAGHPDFVQVMLLSRTAEPLGQRRYWPLFAAAERAGLPIGVHAFGYGGYPVTAGGWPSYYIEEMVGHAQSCQALLTSMVLEGVFERFPGLKLVLIEAGFAWLPSLAWRLDKHWARLRDEVPHLTRPPSAYIREHVWASTQPMEEPEKRRHLHDVIDWIGIDRLLFATDYPHWDYDDPEWSLPVRLGDEARQDLFLRNALKLYGQA
ncbi:MAG TPA: amidohydrolase family protein [Roseomonas sp.]|nr:amidohydrolase family protein [Roseomonas sp.]